MKNDVIKYVRFAELYIKDPFFSSLSEDYPEFEYWFAKKAQQQESAYTLQENGLQGFLYLKEEQEEDSTIFPILSKKRRLKIGTFKILAHGTVLGERFMNIILQHMLQNEFDECYVTIFEKQTSLITLLEKYGFSYWGMKNNVEQVYLKNLNFSNDIYKDFPRISTQSKNKYMLAIYPSYHTKLFFNSKLNTEKDHTIEDLSFTNTIEKYI